MKLADCHPTRKMQARGMCKSCYDKWLKNTNPQYKSNQVSSTTRWCLANPDKWKIIKERRKLKETIDPEFKIQKRNARLKSVYGLEVGDFEQLLIGQDYSCALCFRKQGKIRLHVDHDHASGQVRGLLCHQCNWYLGTIDADPTIIDRITNYRRQVNE